MPCQEAVFPFRGPLANAGKGKQSALSRRSSRAPPKPKDLPGGPCKAPRVTGALHRSRRKAVALPASRSCLKQTVERFVLPSFQATTLLSCISKQGQIYIWPQNNNGRKGIKHMNRRTKNIRIFSLLLALLLVAGLFAGCGENSEPSSQSSESSAQSSESSAQSSESSAQSSESSSQQGSAVSAAVKNITVKVVHKDGSEKEFAIAAQGERPSGRRWSRRSW